MDNYRNKIKKDKKREQKELGRVMIILNNNIGLEKSKMFANLFRNYINEKIDWDEFCEFSEITRMIFINDIKFLGYVYAGKIKETTNHPLYSFDRLISLGLVNTSPKGLFLADPNGKYEMVEKFVCLSNIGGIYYESILSNENI